MTGRAGGEARERVFILGAGRAGRSLAEALRASSRAEVVGLHGRTPDPSAEPPVTAGPLPESLRAASVVLVAVRDAQLDEALHALVDAPLAPRAVVLHLSGSADPPSLAALRERGHDAGTLHPLVPLAEPTRAAALLAGAWFGIDGDDDACVVAERLARAVGARVLVIPPGEKPRYHAAAVFAANFPTVLAAVAEGLLERAGVGAADARAAVERLMAAAVDNLRAGSPSRMLTGPVARGDDGSVARHLEVLDGETRDLYVAATRAALALLGGAGDAPAEVVGRREAIARLLRRPAGA